MRFRLEQEKNAGSKKSSRDCKLRVGRLDAVSFAQSIEHLVELVAKGKNAEMVPMKIPFSKDNWKII